MHRSCATLTLRMAVPLPLRLVASLAVAVALAACGDAPSAPSGRVVAGVDLDELFAEPGADERAAVEAEWAARDVEARDVRVELTATVPSGAGQAKLSVVSHDVDGARHHGAVLVPEGAAPDGLPVLVYLHGGDSGTSAEELLLVAASLERGAGAYVFVAPSFRSESLRVGPVTFRSDGEPSPWDRDVDDAIALLEAVLATVPEADASRIGALGVSRGGGVALLMAIRDPRVDAVVELFGPTDFFDAYVQDVFEEALLGTLRPLPGLAHLDSTVVRPLREGGLSMEEARLELLRRSPVHFADRLPPLQAHHGDADDVVAVSQARSLARALDRLGREPPEWEVFEYPGAGHSILDMPLALARAGDFLERIE